MKKKYVLVTIVGLLLVVGVIAGIKAMQINALVEMGKMMSPPPEAVATDVVDVQLWKDKLRAIGTVTPVRGVTLSAELSGVVKSLNFESGQMVKEGDVLLELDSRSERAELASVEAVAELACINKERASKLLARKTISQAEYDTFDAEHKQAVAQVENTKAVLSKKKVVVPFDGRLGIRKVNLGQYLNPGDSVVSLHSMNPIYVSFFLPQQDLSVVKKGLDVSITSDAFVQKAFWGKVTAIAPEVDQSTRMVEVQALFPNDNDLLTAGMYVNVNVSLSMTRSVNVVPSTAVIYASYGNSVFTVIPDETGDSLKANQNFVRLGQKRGDFVEIIDGLKPGDRIVTAGAFKLYSGVAVTLNDSAAPKPEIEPEVINK